MELSHLDKVTFQSLYRLKVQAQRRHRQGIFRGAVKERRSGVPEAFSSDTKYGLRHPAAASHPLASRWPRPQLQLPVSAIGGGRCSCRTHGSAPLLTHGAPLPGHSLEKLPAHSPWFQGTLSGATVGALSEKVTDF